MAKPVLTIYDVARAAGVSPSTVSNVLNGRRNRMRTETCDRVLHAMQELGFTPSEVARSLKAGFHPTIGLIVPSAANLFWGAFARSVERAAEKRNCQVILCNGERNPAREQQYADSMLARGIHGMILGSAPLSATHLAGPVKRGLNVVAFDREGAGTDQFECDSVSVDNAAGAQLAVDLLFSLGHTRIAFVSGPVISANRVGRLEGYRAACSARGVTLDPHLIWTEPPADAGDEGTAVGKAAAAWLLRLPDPPTAFFAINDMTAFGLYVGLRAAGRTLPRDASVVGFDDVPWCEVVTPALTTVRQPLDELMGLAVNLLLDRVERTRLGPPQHVTLSPHLIMRGSEGRRWGDR